MPQPIHDIQLPTQGRIVVYVDEEGATWPAIVVLTFGAKIHARVFNMNDTIPRLNIPYAPRDERTPQSWHWPPRDL